ncbi:hypothetical protein GBAR_LOCUS27510, partial [Geodia barretti]
MRIAEGFARKVCIYPIKKIYIVCSLHLGVINHMIILLQLANGCHVISVLFMRALYMSLSFVYFNSYKTSEFRL